MATIKKFKKAQNGATADSSSYYRTQRDSLQTQLDAFKEGASKGIIPPIEKMKEASALPDKIKKSTSNLIRQKYKGKPGFDKMGNPAKELKRGGKISKKK